MILSSLLLALAASGSGGDFCVWTYGTDVALRDRLIARGRMYDDLGGYLVGAPDAALAVWAGINPIELTGVAPGDELFVVLAHAHDPHAPNDLEQAGQMVWTSPDGRAQLRAAPKAALGALQLPTFRCHGAGRMISPARPIQAARQPAGGAGGQQNAIIPDTEIQGWVAQVSQANILAGVQDMVNFGTRRHGQPGEVSCENWLEAEFAAMGLTVSTFNYDSAADNVIGELIGIKDPSKIVIIGGHYDSINYSTVAGAAPGADDDASGVSAVLEIARILSQQQFDYTIRFIGWSGEESGLLGSEAYAAHLDNINADVVGMVQLDMVAYRASGDVRSVDFVTNNTDPALNAFAMAVYAAYVPSIVVNSGSLSGGTSDHEPFFQHGFPACFPFEDINQYSPYIHTGNDVIGTSANDFTRAEWITEGALATVAELARPASLTITHTPLADTQDENGPYVADALVVPLGGATTAGVDVVWRVNGGAWNTLPMSPAGPANAWTADLPGQTAPARVEYHIIATASNGRQAWAPEGFSPGENNYAFRVGLFTSIYANGFEGATDEGWTHAQLSTQDDWQRGVPQGKAGDPGAAAAGTKIWGNDLGPSGFNGNYSSNVHNYLRSPVIDCSGRTGVRLRFQRWLTVEEGLYDNAKIEINGTVIWQNPANGNLVDTSWTEVDMDISAWADNNPSVQLTFRLQSDGGLELGGWNIDEFELYVLGAPGGGTNTISLSGPSSVNAGSQANFSFTGAPANAAYWLLNGTNSNGTIFQGHSFDIGGSVMILASGQANGAGAGSITVNIPAGAAGRTGRLEIAAVSAGAWKDSNLHLVSVQ
jgi:leucyl aminopeptidase